MEGVRIHASEIRIGRNDNSFVIVKKKQTTAKANAGVSPLAARKSVSRFGRNDGFGVGG
jgi:hypothetical protein